MMLFLPILIFPVSPKKDLLAINRLPRRTVPCQREEPYPTNESPITVEFGATHSI